MPFAEPERALAATTGMVRKGNFTRQKTARAGASYALRDFNHFHGDSTT